jgi:hypothetical protein
VYYSAGIGSVASFGTATQLPHVGVAWVFARILLNTAGALFATYIIVIIGLLVIGHALRRTTRGPTE